MIIMINVKTMLRKVYHRTRYNFENLFCILRPQKNKYLQNSREILLNYQQIPIGRYDWNETEYRNKKIEVDLSVIIPMYNSEKYIEECLESIINQDTKYTMEIICINDGSTDDTVSIVEGLSCRYPERRIRIINQENRGHAGAKNRGIDEAKGKFIMFVDSDDIIRKDTVEKMLDEAIDKNTEIVCSGFYTFKGNEKSEHIYGGIHPFITFSSARNI